MDNGRLTVRFKVNFEKGRGYVIRYYGSNGRRHAHRIDSATAPEAEKCAARWIAEHVAVGDRPREGSPDGGPTFGQFAAQWTSGELSRRYPDHVPTKVTTKDDVSRLRKYVLPCIGSEPLASFEGDHALDLVERVTAALPSGKAALSPATRRHVLQLVHRVLTLAVYPARILKSQPLPRGFVPKARSTRAKSYLYPSEDALLMACAAVPLLHRLLYGVLAREGLRVSEALTVTWSDVDLDNGVLSLDENKTDNPRAWALDPGVAEALRRWKRLLKSRGGARQPILADATGTTIDPYQTAALLREYLQVAGIGRPQLFESSERRIALRAHDLRASFVTVSLALGKTEAWVTDRTGHTTSAMIYAYKRAARSHAELKLGEFVPLHDAIPELRGVEGDASARDQGRDPI